MPRTRPPYPPESRRRVVELVRAGRTPEALSAEFEAAAQSIRNWAARADRGRQAHGRPHHSGAGGVGEATP